MNTDDGVPRLHLTTISAIAARSYGIVATAHALPSDHDQNALLVTEQGVAMVMKIANSRESAAVIDAECRVMHHLADTALCPRLITTVDGAESTREGAHLIRMITVVDGVPMGRVPWHSDALRRDVGATLARLDRALQGLDLPAVARVTDWDLAEAERVVLRDRDRVVDARVREAIDITLRRYREQTAPQLHTFRRSVIHGDANDYNILVHAREQRVSGVIDFGDMVISHTINDLAIAMAYVALSADDPLAAAAAVAAGYHATYPLPEHEVDALFSLMCMRLAVSACMAARQTAARPDEAYLSISQQQIATALPALAAIHPRYARYVLRDACGFAPVPHSPAVVAWLTARREQCAPLLGYAFTAANTAPLDFSAGSALIARDQADNAPALLDARVRQVLAEHGATIGVGGYREPRLIYHWPHEPKQSEPRTIHMGLDVSMEAGTPLFAPLDGVVFGFEDADAHHDYGPVIVLRHRTTGDTAVDFYTLYGHLTRDSLNGLVIGQPIAKGQCFARIGSAPTNGNWWEHVHVQLITDMLDVPCNVNGAARATHERVWASLCPDPNLLLGIPVERLPARTPAAAISASRAAHIGRSLSVSYGDAPLNIVRGAGAYLFNHVGHRFIDGYNNVAHVGHAHPRVVRAVTEQLAVLNTNTRYLQAQLTDYAAALTALCPPSLSVCFFTASGSEANELALRLARAYTGQRDLLVMESAYHGHTTTLIDISPYKHDGPGGHGAPDWVHTTPIPDCYRHGVAAESAGAHFAAGVGAAIDGVHALGRGVCGYIAETCPSVAGQILMPPGFLADVYARVRAAGGVCIADEVQTGFGRLGTHFWGFEREGVTPDIVVMGKPIANGYPMGAVVTTRAIADAFHNGMEYFSTFGGSTAACVAAAATLRVVQEERLQAHALAVGHRLRDGFAALFDAYELIGDVRGSGLFWGIELVRDRGTREPDAEAAAFVVQRMRERGVLVGTDGPHHNVVKVRGPMVLSMSDAEQMVLVMREAFHKAESLRL